MYNLNKNVDIQSVLYIQGGEYMIKKKVIAGITAGALLAGGVAFGFRDQFLSDKSLYLKIFKNIPQF